MAMGQVACCVFVFLALLLPFLLLNLRKRRENGVRLPPGPWRLPVIGNLHQVIMRCPLVYRTMADLARQLDAPLMYLKLGELPVVVASSPDAAREVMKMHDLTFATRPWSPTVRIMVADGAGLVFARYGVLWRQLRKITILELLSARRVQSFRRVREEEVGRLVAAVAASPPGVAVNVGERIAVAVTDAAVRTMIGDRFERREEFLECLTEGTRIAAGFSLGDLFPSSRLASFIGGTARRAEAHRRRSSELMDCAIRQHGERRTAMAAAADGGAVDAEDLLGVLLRMHKEGGHEVPLAMGIIKTVILDLFSAGSETSVNTLQWAMSELMRNPRVLQKAQAEIHGVLQGKATVTEDDLCNLKYVKLVIKETMRLHPPVPLLLPRECRDACKVMGYDVPKGTIVFVNVWAISRNPQYWDDPNTFKPERFEDGTIDFKGTDFEYTPFGAGRRICPGMASAQATMELVLAALLYHFDWEIPGQMSPDELDMTEDMGITLRRKNDLHLRPVLRVPALASFP